LGSVPDPIHLLDSRSGFPLRTIKDKLLRNLPSALSPCARASTNDHRHAHISVVHEFHFLVHTFGPLKLVVPRSCLATIFSFHFGDDVGSLRWVSYSTYPAIGAYGGGVLYDIPLLSFFSTRSLLGLTISFPSPSTSSASNRSLRICHSLLLLLASTGSRKPDHPMVPSPFDNRSQVILNMPNKGHPPSVCLGGMSRTTSCR
jgi:hypothetical protein